MNWSTLHPAFCLSFVLWTVSWMPKYCKHLMPKAEMGGCLEKKEVMFCLEILSKVSVVFHWWFHSWLVMSSRHINHCGWWHCRSWIPGWPSVPPTPTPAADSIYGTGGEVLGVMSHGRGWGTLLLDAHLCRGVNDCSSFSRGAVWTLLGENFWGLRLTLRGTLKTLFLIASFSPPCPPIFCQKQ